MTPYKPGDDCGALEPWSLDDPAADYRVVSGTPETSGRIDKGGPGHTTRFGVWRCTRGAFDCTEQGDELMTVLSGHCRLTWLNSGESRELGPGDTLFIEDRSRVRWEVGDTLTKVFFAHKADGY